jgi:hypothetical protein
MSGRDHKDVPDGSESPLLREASAELDRRTDAKLIAIQARLERLNRKDEKPKLKIVKPND